MTEVKQRVAGRELDAEIATRVMGEACVHDLEFIPRDVIVARNRAEWLAEWGEDAPAKWEGDTCENDDYPPKWCKHCHVERAGRVGSMNLPCYSTDLAAAFQVVEKMRADGWTLEFNNQDRPVACFWSRYRRADRITCGAETPAPAICFAALAAIESANNPQSVVNGGLAIGF